MSASDISPDTVLLLGASGYIGGRLLPRLLQSGFSVRAAARHPEKLGCRPYADHPGLEIAQVDMLDTESLATAMNGCSTVLSLIHSGHSEPARRGGTDIRGMNSLQRAASRSGVTRILCLIGLSQSGPQKAPAREDQAKDLALSKPGPVPVTCLRASVILGPGSAWFDIIRHLAQKRMLPEPAWLRRLCRPIAVDDLLFALQTCLQAEDGGQEQTLDLCGPEETRVTDLVRLYAQTAGLKEPRILSVPGSWPRLSSWWLHLATPVPYGLARQLIRGLNPHAACPNEDADHLLPGRPHSCRQAIERALRDIDEVGVESCWSDAGTIQAPAWIAGHGGKAKGRNEVARASYRVVLSAEPQTVWPVVAELGGSSGWLFANRLWQLRGFLDRLVGGPGLQRGRRDVQSLRTGDALDFWRVWRVVENSRLTLLAEMKLPGQASLDFQLHDLGSGRTELRLIAEFLPRGLWGSAYWWALYPLHITMFPRLLRRIAAKAGSGCLSGPEPFSPSQEAADCRISENS